jgi:hypothetical protein
MVTAASASTVVAAASASAVVAAAASTVALYVGLGLFLLGLCMNRKQNAHTN